VQIEELGRANEATVKALMDHLLRAYEEFINQWPEDVPYIDAFMGVHNFHVVAILDIERRQQLSPEMQLFFRKLAADTFALAMENKPAFSRPKKQKRRK
jgi:hypothetical protein